MKRQRASAAPVLEMARDLQVTSANPRPPRAVTHFMFKRSPRRIRVARMPLLGPPLRAADALLSKQPRHHG